MDKKDMLGRNRVEDVNWLCCLSEPELMMVLQRAKTIDCKSLVAKFDLKILRALGFILMEHFKENIKNITDIPDLADICASLDRCNLLKLDDKDGSGSASTEELKKLTGNRKRRAVELYNEEVLEDPRGC